MYQKRAAGGRPLSPPLQPQPTVFPGAAPDSRRVWQAGVHGHGPGNSLSLRSCRQRGSEQGAGGGQAHWLAMYLFRREISQKSCKQIAKIRSTRIFGGRKAFYKLFTRREQVAKRLARTM